PLSTKVGSNFVPYPKYSVIHLEDVEQEQKQDRYWDEFWGLDLEPIAPYNLVLQGAGKRRYGAN
ncbi:hypothetical protein GGF37_006819, partial [Kickxella alabastrina]